MNLKGIKPEGGISMIYSDMENLRKILMDELGFDEVIILRDDDKSYDQYDTIVENLNRIYDDTKMKQRANKGHIVVFIAFFCHGGKSCSRSIV